MNTVGRYKITFFYIGKQIVTLINIFIILSLLLYDHDVIQLKSEKRNIQYL